VKHWRALMVLGTAQFLMVLDTSVMNVSISQLVEDFDTEVTAIQAVITLYALVMAAFMATGGRLGDILGRRRMFIVGLMVYGLGSALTAVAPTLWVLTLGWSVIEGLGAAMVLPAMAALVAEAYTGKDRAVAYGVIGGLAGAGIAVGPLLGGWVTTWAPPCPRPDWGWVCSVCSRAVPGDGYSPATLLSRSSGSLRRCSSSPQACSSWPPSPSGSAAGRSTAPTP
jgi:MFS family permease